MRFSRLLSISVFLQPAITILRESMTHVETLTIVFQAGYLDVVTNQPDSPRKALQPVSKHVNRCTLTVARGQVAEDKERFAGNEFVSQIMREHEFRPLFIRY